MSDVTRDEFNGLGGRVSMVETSIAEEKVKTKRTEADVQKIFEGLDKLAATGAETYQQIRNENEKASKDLLIRMVFVFVAGIAIMVLKDLFLKG